MEKQKRSYLLVFLNLNLFLSVCIRQERSLYLFTVFCVKFGHRIGKHLNTSEMDLTSSIGFLARFSCSESKKLNFHP